MTATRVSQHINAPRAAVYRALLDPAAVATWMVPSGMTSQVHAFEAHEGGLFRIAHVRHGDRVGKDDRSLGYVPRPVRRARETGWRMSLAKLAALVEALSFRA